MDEYKKAIIDYEKNRKAVSTITLRRSLLLSSCEKTTREGEPNCLMRAYDETVSLCKDNNEYYPYDGVLSDGNEEGIYCDNCLEAFTIKHGILSDARMEFGKSKRRIGVLGRRLIKETVST